MWKFTMFVFCLSLIAIVFPYGALGAEGYLDILSTPEGVEVFVNGRYVGQTPVTGVEVPATHVTIRAVKNGYGTATHTITVQPNQVKTIRIRLKPTKEVTGEGHEEVVLEQDKGNLLVINQLGEETVYVDGQSKGTGSVKIAGIATGTHQLKVGPFSKEIPILKDYTLKVKVTSSGIRVPNVPPEIKSIKITRAVVNEPVVCEATVTDADNDPVIVTYEIYSQEFKDRRKTGRVNCQGNRCIVKYEENWKVIEGDTFTCKMTPYDGKHYGKTKEVMATIGGWN
jgi:hypothetical protein